MTKKEIIRRAEKFGLKGPANLHILAVACIIFLYIAFNNYTYFLYGYLLIVPCLLFLGAVLERRGGYKPNRTFWLSVLMVAWFVILQSKRAMEDAKLANTGLFLSTYLFAFPFASLLQDGDKKKALKIFAGTYLASAGVLAAFGLLLVLDCLPAFLSEQVHWTGARLTVMWHPNVAACFFMIGAVFCTAFLSQAKSRRAKAGFAVLLVMILGAMSLTNCRTAILLTGAYLGAAAFFAAAKRGKKWLLPGVLAVLVLIAGYYVGANYLYQANYDALMGKYAQQYFDQSASENSDTAISGAEISDAAEEPTETEASDIQEETLPIVIDSDTGEISLTTGSPQGTLKNDLGTLNSRTQIWSAALYAVCDTPSVLYWGADAPGWFVSSYLSFQVPHLHNAWMECLVGMGLVGFIIAVLFTLLTAWNCFAILRKHYDDIWKRNVALLTVCLMAASVLEPYLFCTTADYHPIDLLFFLCAGYLACWREEDKQHIPPAARRKMLFRKN